MKAMAEKDQQIAASKYSDERTIEQRDTSISRLRGKVAEAVLGMDNWPDMQTRRFKSKKPDLWQQKQRMHLFKNDDAHGEKQLRRVKSLSSRSLQSWLEIQIALRKEILRADTVQPRQTLTREQGTVWCQMGTIRVKHPLALLTSLQPRVFRKGASARLNGKPAALNLKASA